MVIGDIKPLLLLKLTTMTTKAIRKPAKKFIPPELNEVELYVFEKKPEWPKSFAEYYAAKFWNHYEASGWRLSSGNPVKKWQACFNSQWQTLKFKEDFDYLAKCVQNEKVVAEDAKKTEFIIGERSGDITKDEMNNLLIYFRKNSEKVSIEKLSEYYEWMKANQYLRLTKDDVRIITDTYGNNKTKCRGAAVSMSLNKMLVYGYKF